MKHSVGKLMALCGLTAMLVVYMAGITAISSHAADNGIYIATATPHYRNPQTGVIEDSGGDGSQVLGQSMTESATYKKALVEVDSTGNTYITVRLQLMDNIRDPQFQVDGQSVNATLMQEDYTNYTADYRMKVNSENSVIRCKMNVIAMGRDVIFFITVSDLRDGSEDFVTSITVENNTGNGSSYGNGQKQIDTVAGDTTGDAAGNSDDGQNAAADATGNDATVESDNKNSENTQTTDILQQEKTESQTENISSKSGDISSKTAGIQEFDDKGNQVKSTSSNNTQTKSESKAPVIISVIVILAAAAGGAVWYFIKKRR